MRVLALSVGGVPWQWLEVERAAHYLAGGKVAWHIGDPAVVLRGGTQRATGQMSQLAIPPVIALAKSEVMSRHTGIIPLGREDNTLLARRDGWRCAYCGEHVEPRDLTRDHIVPRARGGRDVWTNVVTAHRVCNMRKGCRTPSEASMELLFVPYAPCRAEHMLLSGRNILADQLEFLSARLPAHSRVRLS